MSLYDRFDQGIEQRYALDAQKRDTAAELADRLTSLAVGIYDWQVGTRGTGSYAGYGETRAEIDRMLEQVGTQVGVRLARHHRQVSTE